MKKEGLEYSELIDDFTRIVEREKINYIIRLLKNDYIIIIL